jgi:hypothetical protein
MMAAKAGADVHHGAQRCLLGLFDTAATGPADCSEFETEAESRGIEVRGLSRKDLSALIEESGTRGAGVRIHPSHLRATRRT